MTTASVSILAGLIVLAACAQSPPTNDPPRPGGGSTFVITGDQKADWDQILALEKQAKSLVRAGGCTSVDQCRTAPVGSRACGGPRYYLVYCARTTDSAALSRKLDDVAAAERAFNTRYNVMSTCEFRMPPSVGVTGGMCTAREMGEQIR